MLSQLVAISFARWSVFALKLSSSSRVVIFTYGAARGRRPGRLPRPIWTYQQRRLAKGVYAKNVLLVGQPRSRRMDGAHFRRNVQDTEFRLAGWLSVLAARHAQPERRRDDALRTSRSNGSGDVDDLGDLLVHHPVHEIIAIQSSVDRDWLRQVIDHCDYFRIRLRIVPEALLVRRVGDLQLAFRDDPLRLPEVVLVAAQSRRRPALFVKRLIDIVVSADAADRCWRRCSS